MTEEAVKHFGMRLGDLGWVHANLLSPKALGPGFGDPCVVVGLCACPGTMEHIAEISKGSPYDCGGWEVCTRVARHV